MSHSKPKLYWITLVIIFTAFVGIARTAKSDTYILDEVRQFAKRMEDESMLTLPRPIDTFLILHKIRAVDTQVQMWVTVNYSDDQFSAEIGDYGHTVDSAKIKMRSIALDGICNGELIKSFIYLGGNIKYIFEFNNGKFYTSFVVDKSVIDECGEKT